jgi:UDP-3-O-[3-hydroxymyristoyl] glucosamine N-acyltransferase
MKLSQIAKILELENNKDIEINGINTLKDAKSDEITFFHNKKYLKDLPSTKAGAILIQKEFSKYIPKETIPLFTDEPYLKLAILTKYFAKPLLREGKAEIDKTAIIANNVTIGANTKIGKNVIIQAGAVIGSDGFGYAHTKTEHIKIYHLGYVEIEDDVEIGANTTIDRGAFGKTIIKKGAKIDNLVQIGHNCEIGEHSILVSQVGLAGSSILGRNVVMGGQSATSGHLKIAPFTQIAARGGVTKDIKESGVYGGFPLLPQKTWLKLQAKIAGLLKK